MTQKFYTADQHFFHRNIIDFCDRPFLSVDQMNEAIIANHNDRVTPADEVYMLGDISFQGSLGVDILKNLNGQKHLIIGNHDCNTIIRWAGWKSIQEMKEVKDGGDKIILCHYPLLSWNGMWKGSFHFHGHCHGTLRDIGHMLDLPRHAQADRLVDRKMCDVGVDSWNFTPVTKDEIMKKMFQDGRWGIV